MTALITPPTPRLVGAAVAAAYLGLSPRGFEQMWRRGIFPQPHRVGRRILWDLKLLDRYVDRLSGLDEDRLDPADDWSKIV